MTTRRGFLAAATGLFLPVEVLADFVLPDAVLSKPKKPATTNDGDRQGMLINGKWYEFRYYDRTRDWTWPGSTLKSLQQHVLTSPNHRGKFNREWVLGLPFEHLKALHSDDHEGRVKWSGRHKTPLSGTDVELNQPAKCPT